MVTPESYQRDYDHMLAATKAWHLANPDTALVFHPLGYPEDTAVLAGLVPALIRRVGGNHKTRELLRTMDEATGQQGTVLQAEVCIEAVFGLKRAISGYANVKTQPAAPIPCPQCRNDLNVNGMLDKMMPRAGDFCVCGHCALVLRMNETLTPRPATPAERENLSPKVIKMVQVVEASLTKPS